MKKLGIWGLAGLLGLLVASGVWAQPGSGPGAGRGQGAGQGQGAGRGAGDPFNRMYQPATVETVRGEVAAIDKSTAGRGGSYGVHFTLKTDQETIPVHLGPGWYVDQQEVKLAPGDKVEVTGSRITYQGKPALIAAQVKKDGKTLQLRNANGVPVWAGQRWR
ncbi:MAG: DNA-binding protein [Thermodesulfobacteriota bacterium]